MKTQLNELIERWEECARACDELADIADTLDNYITRQRCKTKAGMFRSLAAEIGQEIQVYDKLKRDYQDFAHKLTHCQECGEFRGHGHVCKEGVTL
jgi:hypothetical protein